MSMDKRYNCLVADICWLKSDISNLVRLKCYSVARIQMRRMRRLIFLKTYIENLGYIPDWYSQLRKEY